MGWKQIRELDRAGVQIGSHSVTHPNLKKASPDQLTNEIDASIKTFRAS